MLFAFYRLPEVTRSFSNNLEVVSFLENMTFLTSWDEFSKAAERLYLNDPMKVPSNLFI